MWWWWWWACEGGWVVEDVVDGGAGGGAGASNVGGGWEDDLSVGVLMASQPALLMPVLTLSSSARPTELSAVYTRVWECTQA